MKRFFLYAVAFLATSAGFVSCAEDEVNPEAKVSVAEEKMALTAEGGSFELNITAPTAAAYSVETPDWISIMAPRSQTNTSEKLTFVAAMQNSCQERTGNITFTCGSLSSVVPVTQNGIELAADKENVTVAAAGGTLPVKLTAAPNYKVACPDWIVMNENPQETHLGNITADISFTIAENTATTERNDSIIFTCCEQCNDTVKIYVAQKGAQTFDLTKMVKFSATETSIAYGDVYDPHTIGLIWSETNSEEVFVCNIEPYYAKNGFTVDKGYNYVKAQYLADYNVIAITADSSINIASQYELSCAEGDAQGKLGHVYLYLNEDKTAITRQGLLYTIYFKEDGSIGAEDAYAGPVTYTIVAE